MSNIVLQLLSTSEQLLQQEIKKTNLPPIENHKICLVYGKKLAQAYKIDLDFIAACLNFMDVKIGQTVQENRRQDHIQMSLDATLKAIRPINLDSKTITKIRGCILSHHGADPYPSIEAEICANADCFKFLHPRGLLVFIADLGRRGMKFNELLNFAKEKIEEKMATISLPEVKPEAKEYYRNLIKLINAAQKQF